MRNSRSLSHTLTHTHRLTKLAGLLMKTLAKPLSKRIKHDFSRYELTRGMLVSVGQASHQITSRMTIWSSGYQVRSVPRLEEATALKTGAEFVGEAFIVVVSGGIIVWEYNRSSESNKRKEAKRRADEKAERDALHAKLDALDIRLLGLEESLQKLQDESSSSSSALDGTRTTTNPNSWGWAGWKPTR